MAVAAHLIAPLALAASTITVAQPQSPVADTSSVASDGERVLQQTIEIDAPVERVWRAFTTTAGFRSWASTLR